MAQRISSKQFHAAEGVEEWRVLPAGATAHYLTGTFEKGLELVGIIGKLAAAAEHHPDIDLRYPSVTVRLFSHDVMELTEKDLDLARQISMAARTLGIEADPSRVQSVQFAIDTLDIPAAMPFWRAVLGYEEVGGEDVTDPTGRGPNVWFQATDERREGRGRIHVDLYVGRDEAENRITAALAVGGTMVSDENAPEWWTLADPDGNLVDVAPWPDDAD